MRQLVRLSDLATPAFFLADRQGDVNARASEAGAPPVFEPATLVNFVLAAAVAGISSVVQRSRLA
jgi:hypothetical protein